MNADIPDRQLPGRPAEKPHTVRQAEIALWIWTALTCLFGFYQSWAEIPQIESTMSEQLQGVLTIEPQRFVVIFAVGYLAIAALSGWVILRIGAGKHWARSSLVWGIVIQALSAAWPPYIGLELLEDIPDFGLQLYALYLLYTRPGSDWFTKS